MVEARAAAIGGDRLSLVRQTIAGFGRHKAHWLAAAIAYYATFAIAPLIIVIVEIGGFFLGHHQVLLNQIYGYLAKDAGPSTAAALRSIVATTFAQHHAGIGGQVIAWALFLLGALGVFSALHEALNTVWEVGSEGGGIRMAIHVRVISFAIVALMALLLLASVLASAALSVAANALHDLGPFVPLAARVAEIAISWFFLFLAFSAIFKFLPDRQIRWSDIWFGAAMTSAAFVLGQTLLGWYLGRAGVASGFGAYGALIIFLIWINYSAQIMLLGAEFTHAYARNR